jgi:hypothetical protein
MKTGNGGIDSHVLNESTPRALQPPKSSRLYSSIDSSFQPLEQVNGHLQAAASLPSMSIWKRKGDWVGLRKS